MKWIFIAGLLVLIPMLTSILRAQRKYRPHAAFALGLLPFAVVPYLYVAPISWAGWPGPVKGVEVSLLDGVALAVLLSTPSVRIPLSLRVSIGIVLVALAVSTSVAFQTVPSLFYAWQLLRTIVLFLAVARICFWVPSAPIAMLAGLGTGLVFEAALAVDQFFAGNPRPGGNLGHSNFLGLASDFVVFPALALLVGGRRIAWPALIVVAGMVIAIVGGSRATLGLFALGSMLTVILSLRHGRTPRKIAFASAAAFILAVAAPALVWAADRRSEADKISSDQERASMKLAASMMIADHPFGVGPNQYVIVANTGGYSARAGVPWNAEERAAPVHEAYYLVAAELGFLGLIGLASILLSLIVLGFGSLGTGGTASAELLPGLLVGAIVVAIHISFEWVFVHFVLQYMLALSAGMLVAVRARSKSSGRAKSGALLHQQVAAQGG